MLIPIGILASAGGVTGAFELISTTVLGANTASVTFSGLNTGIYKHLQIRITDRSTAAGSSQAYIRFNGDSGANYSEHQIYGGGSSVGTYGGASVNLAPLGSGAESGAPANAFSGRIVDILDPFNTTKNTSIRELQGLGPTRIGLYSAGWYNTAAVTTIEIGMFSANFVTGSRFSLYGIKG